MKIIIENIIRFVLLILIQVLFLDKIQVLSFCTPYIYILFLLSLPVYCPRWADLLLGFALGICIDIFSNILGLHAFACVLIAYLRFFVIKLFVSEDDRVTETPSFHSFGTWPYVKYVIVLVTLHHATLFALETFSLTNWWFTLLRILISSIVSIGIIISLQLLKKNKTL